MEYWIQVLLTWSASGYFHQDIESFSTPEPMFPVGMGATQVGISGPPQEEVTMQKVLMTKYIICPCPLEQPMEECFDLMLMLAGDIIQSQASRLHAC